MSADPRAPGRPCAIVVALSSHTQRGSSSLSHRCAVCAADWTWACPATRAASCSAADGGRTASARLSYIGSIMRSPSYAIDHHRSMPSPEPIIHRATKRICNAECFAVLCGSGGTTQCGGGRGPLTVTLVRDHRLWSLPFEVSVRSSQTLTHVSLGPAASHTQPSLRWVSFGADLSNRRSGHLPDDLQLHSHAPTGGWVGQKIDYC